MFDMEMLNDALNMPLPLFSTGKGRGNRPSSPSSRLLSLPGERGPLPPPPPPRFYCSSNVYLSKTKGATVPTWWVNPTSSSEPVDRLPVRIDSGAMRCRTFSATPPAIPPIILYPPLLPPSTVLFNHASV